MGGRVRLVDVPVSPAMHAMHRPNLFIIGAAKCGTTSLHQALDRHSAIFMSDLKEPAFFVPELKYHPKDEDWYLGLFQGAGTASIVGESTTHYSKIPLFEGVPGRVHAFAPDAKVIYLMRDPIDRVISHYWHNTFSVRPEFKEERPMLQAVREDRLYRSYSDYAMQLRPWLDRFGADSVLPLVYEEMVTDSPRILREVQEWLGLDPEPGVRLGHRNARRETVVRTRGFGLLEAFRHSPMWERLAPLVPSRLRTVARQLAVTEEEPRFEDQSEEVTAHLRPWAADRIKELRELLGRDFPDWKTSREGSRTP